MEKSLVVGKLKRSSLSLWWSNLHCEFNLLASSLNFNCFSFLSFVFLDRTKPLAINKEENSSVTVGTLQNTKSKLLSLCCL